MGEVTAALARLLGAQGQEIDDRVRDSHLAVADRVFRALGPLGAPVQPIHDGIAGMVHAGLRAGFGAAGRAIGAGAQLVDDDRFLASDRGMTLAGVVVGLLGEEVAATEPALTWPTTLLRPDGELLAVHGDGVPGRLLAPTVVVLLHGLCETERSWGWGTDRTRPSVPARLAADGREIVLARVNSGRRPAATGAELAELLETTVSLGVQRVVFVGHSMGGLVARGAIRHAERSGHEWVSRCDTLVTLGTPHLGAPLERAVAALVAAGSPVPEVAAVVSWFEQRASGIRDLRHGTFTDDGPPGLRVAAPPLPRHVVLHTIAAELTPPPVAAMVGDGLVRKISAHGIGVRRPVNATRGEPLDVEGSHFALLSDPVVGEHVAAIVDGRAPRASAI